MADQLDKDLSDNADHAGNAKMLIIAAAVFVLIAGSLGAYFALHGKHSDKVQDEKKPIVVTNPGFYQLEDMLINLIGDQRRPNYLRIKIVIELADENDKAFMDTIQPKIVDQFQTYLRELRTEDLKGSIGMHRLKEELLIRVSEIAKPIKINDILFQEVLVQ